MAPPALTETSAFPQPPSPGTVSPAAQQALQNLPDPGGPEDLQAHRAMCAELQRTLGGSQMERHGVRMEERAIAGVPVRIYTSAAPAQRPDGVLLNLHGGGFIVDAGSVTENVPVAAYTGMPVISVRYRLAPEHPFPAALDDAERVYREVIARHGASRLILYGTSAGACLCAQLLVRLRERQLPLPRALGFFSGTADLSRRGDSEFFFRPERDRVPSVEQFFEYVGHHDRSSQQVSPIFTDLRGFPPTLCIAGTRDFMLSQTGLFHQALLAADVDARLLVFEAMPHAHWIFLDLPESDQAFRAMAQFFTSQLRTPGRPFA
ncbi:MAG TPA: alpha/beta hydrolase [Steroidobacteraceae bacterium]|nr:alpha/beta hydrolase [Steroidobacteraceae bacterium]